MLGSRRTPSWRGSSSSACTSTTRHIARLALRRLVDVLVVVTGDSDMIPAFKFARREGVRVVLDHLGSAVKRDLKAHVDIVL